MRIYVEFRQIHDFYPKIIQKIEENAENKENPPEQSKKIAQNQK